MFNGKLLKISVLILLLFAFAVPASIFVAFPESGYAQSSEQPTVSIINTTSEYMDVIVRFPANPLGNFPNNLVFDETIYSRPSEVGVPDLPVLRRNIEFPTGYEFTVELLESTSSIQTLGDNGLPGIIPERPAEVQKCEFGETCEDVDGLEYPDKIGSADNPDELNKTEIIESETTEEPINDPGSIDLPVEETENPDEIQNPDGIEDSEDLDETDDSDENNDVDNKENLDQLEEIDIEEEEISLNPDNLFPSTPAKLADSYIIRGHQIGLLEFWPVQYDPESQMVIIYEELVVRINFHQDGIRTQSVSSMAYTSDIFNEILASEVINFDLGIRTQSKSSTNNEAILIIAPDSFMSTANALVNLKQSQGHPVTLVGLSTTGTTPDAIKNYIQIAYNSWSTPLTYVTLIGDVNIMPAYTGASTGTVTDLYFGTVDGSDWIPDVFVGRLPARNTSQLNIMINNLAAYNNLTGSENWVKKAAFLASNDSSYWQVAEATQNYVIDTHTKSAGYTGTFPSNPIAGGDKLYAHTYGAGNSQVVGAINNGRSLISYTGHGSRISWGGPSYNQSNIRNITTGALSVVTSFACVTGDFGYTESFGETWMIQHGKGAVAFIGSSANSYWGADDILERAMMDSLYSGTDTANIVSYFLYAGLMEVHQRRPGTGTAQSRYYWETYNLLGDPSLRMSLGPPDYMPRLSSSKLTVSQAPGNNTKVQLQLTNAGANADSYKLDTVTNGWVTSFQPRSTISLSPGESAIIEFDVSIPEDAEFGQSEFISLTVTSQSDSSATASALIEIKAGILNFIPLVIRP